MGSTSIRRLSELRGFSATSYLSGTVLGGDADGFSIFVLLRNLAPLAAGTAHIVGNATGSTGWRVVRNADTDDGSVFNFAFEVHEGGVAQTLDIPLQGDIGKVLLLHVVYEPGTPSTMTAYVGGVEAAVGSGSSSAYSTSIGVFSVGYNVNTAADACPEESFLSFGYAAGVAFSADDVASNTLEILKRQDVTDSGLPSGWTNAYSVDKDAGFGVPSTLRNIGSSIALNQTLTATGRTDLILGSAPFYLAEATKTDGSGPGPTPTEGIYEVYVSAANGSDANNGETPATAVETLERAKALVPLQPTQPIVIHVGSGNYVYSAFSAFIQSNISVPVYILGDGAGQAGETGFTVVDAGVAGAGSTSGSVNFGVGSTDLYAGLTLEFTAGALVNQRRTISHNTTTALTPAARFTAAPTAGDAFQIKRPSANFDMQVGCNLGAGVGYGQAESPLVLVNVNLTGPNEDTAIRIAGAHVLMYGVTMRGEGQLVIVDSTVHAGTLYADASDTYGAFGNLLPFQGTTNFPVNTDYVDDQLTEISASLFNWNGWGLSVQFSASTSLPLQVDSGEFVGYLVATSLTLTPAAKVHLVGGSVLDNGVSTHGIVNNNGGYLIFGATLTQRLNVSGTLVAPLNPFRLASDGTKTGLQTRSGGVTIIDAITMAQTGGAASIQVIGAGSACECREGTAVVGDGEISVTEGGTLIVTGAMTTAANDLTVTDGGIVVVINGSALTFDAITLHSGAQVQVNAASISAANTVDLQQATLTIVDTAFDFNGAVSLASSSRLLVDAAAVATTADLGTVLQIVDGSELNIADYNGIVRVNNGGPSATNSVTLSGDSKFRINGTQLTVTGRVVCTQSEFSLSGALGTTSVNAMTFTNSDFSVNATSGVLSITDTVQIALRIINSDVYVAGCNPTMGGTTGSSALYVEQGSNVVFAPTATLNIADALQVFDSKLTLESSATTVAHTVLFHENAEIVLRNGSFAANASGTANTDIGIRVSGASVTQINCVVTCTGSQLLEAIAKWTASGNVGACTITAGTQPAGFTISGGSTYEALGVTAGTLTITIATTASAVCLYALGAATYIALSDFMVPAAPAGDTRAFQFFTGGRLYLQGVVPVLGTAANNFADEQGTFARALVNTNIFVQTGAHPGGVYTNTSTLSGSGFVQRI